MQPPLTPTPPSPPQVVFRHGARTPLSTAFFPDAQWACDESYSGPDLELVNAAGGPPPPYVDPDAPRLPGGCRQGTLTARGFEMARDLGRQLRGRYVDDLGLLPPTDPPGGALRLQTTMFRRTVATLRVRRVTTRETGAPPAYGGRKGVAPTAGACSREPRCGTLPNAAPQGPALSQSGNPSH